MAWSLCMGLLTQITVASGPGLDLSLPPAPIPREGVGWSKIGVECDKPTNPILDL